MAVLIKHLDLGHVVLTIVEQSIQESGPKPLHVPKAMAEMCKVVCQAKWSLIRVSETSGSIPSRAGHVFSFSHPSFFCFSILRRELNY